MTHICTHLISHLPFKHQPGQPQPPRGPKVMAGIDNDSTPGSASSAEPGAVRYMLDYLNLRRDNLTVEKKEFDPSLPGASLANFIRRRSEEEHFQLVDGLTCAACGKHSSGGAAFQFCSRCQTVSYCCRLCSKSDWAVHKRECRDQESRIDELANKLKCNREMIKLALEAVDENTQAARYLCLALTSPAYAAMGYSNQDLCDALQLLFGAKLSVSRLRRIARKDKIWWRQLKAAHTKYAEEEAKKEKAFISVKACCSDIYQSLVEILPALGLYRNPSDENICSNKELVGEVYEKVKTSYKGIPFFLQFVDNCLASRSVLSPELCKIQPKQMKKKMRKVEKMVFSCWVQFTRIFEGDMDGKSDGDIVKMSRKRWWLSLCYQRRQKFGKEWLKEPGLWMPWHMVPKEAIPE